jgi:hypothetical protein
LKFITIAPGLAAVLALVIMITYSGIGSGATNTTFGQNEKAANGKLLGNVSLIKKEQKCIAAEHPESQNVPWFPSLVNTEQHDSERTKVWDCGHFTGS